MHKESDIARKAQAKAKAEERGRGKQPKELAPGQVELQEVQVELPLCPVIPRVLFQSHPEAEAESMAAEAPNASSSPVACVPVPAEQEPAETRVDQAAAANLQEEPAHATLDAQPAEPLPAEEHSC